MRLRAVVLCVIAAVLTLVSPASAHKPSDAYLTLVDRGDRLDVRWDIAVRDLDFALDLDLDQDGKITWSEVEARRDAILGYATARLDVTRGGAPCAFADTELRLASHSDGPYVALLAQAACGAAPDVKVRYALFHELDREHRGVLRLVSGPIETVGVLDGASPPRSFTLGAPQSFADVVGRGVVHIWTGIDHVLFLLALLLPAVLLREGGAWKPRPSLREAAWDTARVVTAFTLAHSITLSLARWGSCPVHLGSSSRRSRPRSSWPRPTTSVR